MSKRDQRDFREFVEWFCSVWEHPEKDKGMLKRILKETDKMAAS